MTARRERCESTNPVMTVMTVLLSEVQNGSGVKVTLNQDRMDA
jgi:hypothetical protein